MQVLPRARGRVLVLVCLMSLSSALFLVTAHSQGVTATAKPVASSTPSDVATMKRRIDGLERRILELEKQKADELQADKDDDASAKKLEQRLDSAYSRLEQRLASIESAQHNEQAQENAAATSSTTRMPVPQSIRAPFTVVDGKGTILTVMRGTAGGARMVLGNPRGAQVNMSVAPDGVSSIQLVDSNMKVKIHAEASASRASINFRGKEGYTLLGDVGDGTPLVQILNAAQIPVAELRGMLSHDGQLNIFDANGVLMIAAGVATNGVGVVKTGPGGHGPAATLGNAGMAASEIQGRK